MNVHVPTREAVLAEMSVRCIFLQHNRIHMDIGNRNCYCPHIVSTHSKCHTLLRMYENAARN